MRYLRCISALLCYALCNSAASGCGPLAATAVFVVEAGQGQPEGQASMVLLPVGKWNPATRSVEPYYPDIKAPDIEWMPKELYADCDYRLFDSRGRFVRTVHINRSDANYENAGYYVLPGLTDLPASGERYIATNVPTVSESTLVPAQLTHRQHIEAAKRVIPVHMDAQRARGDGTRKLGPQDFLVSAFRVGERIMSWWVADSSVTLVEFGPAITVQTFPAGTPDTVSAINNADEAPGFVIDMDGDGESETLFSVAHDGGGGFLFLTKRDGRWIASAEARIGGC